ncbi:hypothetical protein [Prevotella phocaeensis]|uniref:hypothetical protein n=1 Tax=Prevotella phocaeensis TaxID=1776388 RepID=UPI0012B569C5|nr:hypothetical protein [Prevotella phocaeensis]
MAFTNIHSTRNLSGLVDGAIVSFRSILTVTNTSVVHRVNLRGSSRQPPWFIV